jgi:hypothetical protein
MDEVETERKESCRLTVSESKPIARGSPHFLFHPPFMLKFVE